MADTNGNNGNASPGVMNRATSLILPTVIIIMIEFVIIFKVLDVLGVTDLIRYI